MSIENLDELDFNFTVDDFRDSKYSQIVTQLSATKDETILDLYLSTYSIMFEKYKELMILFVYTICFQLQYPMNLTMNKLIEYGFSKQKLKQICKEITLNKEVISIIVDNLMMLK